MYAMDVLETPAMLSCKAMEGAAMAFQERAESWRSKAHLGGVRLPLLVGVTALAVLVLVGVVVLLLDSFGASGVNVVPATAEQSSAAQVPADEPVELVFVHVGGAVASPGVYELPKDSRVIDAVEAAGGFTEAAVSDALNLARVLADGEQIVVPDAQALEATSQEGAQTQSGTAAAIQPAGKININTASEADLDTLPGVGPSTAQKIVADREANGPFATCEDLKRVSGIGDKKYAALADVICVV